MVKILCHDLIPLIYPVTVLTVDQVDSWLYSRWIGLMGCSREFFNNKNPLVDAFQFDNTKYRLPDSRPATTRDYFGFKCPPLRENQILLMVRYFTGVNDCISYAWNTLP